MAGRSCCGQSGSGVLEFRFQLCCRLYASTLYRVSCKCKLGSELAERNCCIGLGGLYRVYVCMCVCMYVCVCVCVCMYACVRMFFSIYLLSMLHYFGVIRMYYFIILLPTCSITE